MSLDFEEKHESRSKRDIITRVREYESEFKELIADAVWKYLDRAGINVDKWLERELDEVIISTARELADLLARKVQNVSKIVSAIEKYADRVENLESEIRSIVSKINKVIEYTDGSLRDDLTELSSTLSNILPELEKSRNKLKETASNADKYVKELEDKMETMSEEAADDILRRYEFK